MISGNGPAELKKMIREMQDVSKGRALEPLTKAMAHETVVRIKDCFGRSQTPYGDGWAPVKRGGMPLLDTSRLRNAFQDNSAPGRIEINNPTKYAALMNFGGRFAGAARKGWMFVKARMFLPDDRGLPAAWAAKLEAVARAAFAKRFPSLQRES